MTPQFLAISVLLLAQCASAGYLSMLSTSRRSKGPGAHSGDAAAGPSEEIENLAGEGFDWLSNLGAPAALVAGAIMATLVEQEDMLKTNKRDTKQWARMMKRSAHVLLITAFAMSLFSIFGTTVTGTMLKGLGDGHKTGWVETTSAMAFMRSTQALQGLGENPSHKPVRPGRVPQNRAAGLRLRATNLPEPRQQTTSHSDP